MSPKVVIKKIGFSVVVFLALFVYLTLGSTAYAAGNIKVELDGAALTFDVQPQVINNYTYVPLRNIFEALGADVAWDEDKQSITSSKDGTSIYMEVGKNEMTVNGKTITLDAAPMVKNYRTLVPVRAVAESFDCTVDWNNGTQTVAITSGSGSNNSDNSSDDNATNAAINKNKYTAVEIAEKVKDGVFYIELYNKAGQAVASGSGFFINSDGTAVTNYHVIEDAANAKVYTTDGKSYTVSAVLGYDKDRDIAIIKVEGSGFQALNISQTDVVMGETIYCFGSPLGLESTMSTGIVSNAKRRINGNTYFQMTASISSGSSGGAVVNERGEVVGISTASVEGGQSLNLAVPAAFINEITLDTNKTLSELFSGYNIAGNTPSTSGNTIPDVGALKVNENEPNDYMEDALVIKNGSTIYGVVDDNSDLDTFKIYVPKGKTLTAILATDTFRMLDNMEILIADSNGDVLKYSDYPSYQDSGIGLYQRITEAGYYYVAAYIYDESRLVHVPYAMYVYYE